jgi:iron complex transport system substrate-binding protein
MGDNCIRDDAPLKFWLGAFLVKRTALLFSCVLLSLWFDQAALAHMRTITDLVGRTLQVPRDPRRIVALAPSITEIVFALGQEHRLKGVSRFSDYPPAANAYPKVGSYVHLDIERIVALQPDVCIGIKEGNPLAVVKQLDTLKIPVFVVHPRDMNTVMESILAIGELLAATDKAQAVTADMRKRIDAVKQKTDQVSHRPGVFVQIGISPIVSVGSDTFMHQLITLAGGTNVAAGANPYPRFSREQVISLAPEVMVIASMARATVFEEVKKQWMQWPVIPAVQKEAVHIAPSNIFDRPTPRIVDGLEQMARYIHPDLYKVLP